MFLIPSLNLFLEDVLHQDTVHDHLEIIDSNRERGNSYLITLIFNTINSFVEAVLVQPDVIHAHHDATIIIDQGRTN